MTLFAFEAISGLTARTLTVALDGLTVRRYSLYVASGYPFCSLRQGLSQFRRWPPHAGSAGASVEALETPSTRCSGTHVAMPVRQEHGRSVSARAYGRAIMIWWLEISRCTVAAPSLVDSTAASLHSSALTITHRHAVLTHRSSPCSHARPHVASGGPRWSCGMHWLRPWSIRPCSSYFRNGLTMPCGQRRRARDGRRGHLCRCVNHRDDGRSARIPCGIHASITAEQYEPMRSSLSYIVT